jgi:hypothetical protein
MACLIDVPALLADNARMKTTESVTAGPEWQDDPDAQAVLRHAIHGAPLDPAVARRVRERGERATEEIYRLHGELDSETITALFPDDDET